jgi:SAM-dependent methyltransferase
MVDIRRHHLPADEAFDETAMALFQQGWETYRKVVDHNYMFHREVCGLLRRILEDEAAKPIRFLDIACGDARATVGALKGLPVAHYYGIDLSRPALELARAAVGALGCPATLHERDFVDALADWSEPVDVAWIGQSLHHLLAPGKLALMRRIRDIVGERGLFLIWEPTLLEGEGQDGWVHRLDLSGRSAWTALTPAEREAMLVHCRDADFAETAAGWLALGRGAGFGEVQELYAAPTGLARVYRFRA